MTAPLDLAALRKLAEAELAPDRAGDPAGDRWIDYLAATRPAMLLQLLERVERAEALLRDALAEPFEFTVSIGLENRIRDHLAGKP